MKPVSLVGAASGTCGPHPPSPGPDPLSNQQLWMRLCALSFVLANTSDCGRIRPVGESVVCNSLIEDSKNRTNKSDQLK